MSFAAGETSKTVDVPLIPNPFATGSRSLTLKLQDPAGGASLGSPSSTTLTITKVGIWFSQTAYTVNEGPGTATITVNRAGTASGVTVQVQTQDGSAVAPTDYTAFSPPQTLTFSGGQTSKTFTVQIGNNPASSVNRSLQVRLLNATGEPLGSPNVATVTILDKGLAELQLTAFTPPSTALIGKTIAVPNTVQNLSGLSAPSSTLRFVLSRDATLGNADDVVLGTRSISSLGAGASSPSTTTLTIPGNTAPGVATLFAVVDATNAVAEQNEGNNVASAPLMLLANVVRTFGVSGVLTTTGCTSSLRNGRAVALGIRGHLEPIRRPPLTGTLSLTFPLAAGLSTSGPLTATLDDAGHLTGTVPYTTKQGSMTHLERNRDARRHGQWRHAGCRPHGPIGIGRDVRLHGIAGRTGHPDRFHELPARHDGRATQGRGRRDVRRRPELPREHRPLPGPVRGGG